VLQQWIGRSETMTDTLDPRRARLLELTLDREASLAAGDPLPPLWHWIYFLGGARMSRLGRDGHAARGELLPPVDLPRRMWAGSRIRWYGPLTLGREARRTSRIAGVEMKSGRTGPLCFVTIDHDVEMGGWVRMTEEQDLVFRRDPGPDDSRPSVRQTPSGDEWRETVTPTPVQLFRYSALTFNSHRIHYDRDYVTRVEGYPGLIVHGPLVATLLADLVSRNVGPALRSFDFRATAPLFDTASFTIHGRRTPDGAELWAETPDGGQAMRAVTAW